MLSGIKFIPRDQIDKENDGTTDSRRKRTKYASKQGKCRMKNNRSSNSSSEDDLNIIENRPRKKKWYSSDEDLSSYSDYSGSTSGSENENKKHRSAGKGKRRCDDSSENEHKGLSKKKPIRRRKEYSPETKHQKRVKSELREDDKCCNNDNIQNDLTINMDEMSQSQMNKARKEMGLEWMLLQPNFNMEKSNPEASHIQPEKATAEEMKDNPRELNPYLKNNGCGYPEESDGMKVDGKLLLASGVVGDGGASWRLKALKRAQEQANREGLKLKEVVEERWGSMGHFAASLASHKVAPTHAHLHAIKNRRKGLNEEQEIKSEEFSRPNEKDSYRSRVGDILPSHHKMRVPQVHDSLSWGRPGYKNLSTEDTAFVNAAMSDLNKFSNDGSFMDKFTPQKSAGSDRSGNSSYQKLEVKTEHKSVEFDGEVSKEDSVAEKPALSANQLAAKAMQLRMKGKHEEAEKLLNEAEKMKTKQDTENELTKSAICGAASSFIHHDANTRQKRKEEDVDLQLAKKIMHNNRFSVSSQADEEYDYDDGPRRKPRKKGRDGNHKSSVITSSAKRFLTQQDRCQFCFENQTRPKHLAIAIANFTYLSLPQIQPVVPGHCYILTLQHESSTRSVDETVWDEIRNFKKCLIMMFGKQDKDVVFLETVVGLAQQRRHCLVECIPLPLDIAKQAPVYFKKAIDEAEDEWSQHNAKKLIDTSTKGLRNSIPKNFPYFHVEFGLNKGFLHVIDNEKDFKTTLGINVIRGMLQLPAEDMHRRWKYESLERQKQTVASFARDWEPFDWTRQLE